MQCVCGWVYEHTGVCTDARLLGVCTPCASVCVFRQHVGTVGVCFGGECNPSRSCFPDLRWRKTALAVCRFISSTGVQNKEKMIDWLMNNLEVESCGTSRLSARLPRSRSLLKDRVSLKKLLLIVLMCVTVHLHNWYMETEESQNRVALLGKMGNRFSLNSRCELLVNIHG